MKIEAETHEKSNKEDKSMYKSLQTHLEEILLKNGLLEQIHVVVASIASSKTHRMSMSLNRIYSTIIQVYHDLNNAWNQIEDLQRNKFGANDEDFTFTGKLRKYYVRFIAWTICLAITTMIIDTFEAEDKNKADKQSLMKSKLLSGGIEDRFVC